MKREDTKKSNTEKSCVKNSQGESNAGKSRTEIMETSCAAQNSTQNERAGYARDIGTGRGQFQRYTEYSQKFAKESEQLNRQPNLNTVDTREQSSSSFNHKINTSKWQTPRETAKARPLLSNQITTRNYFGVLEDCDTVTRDLENVESDRNVAPGELEYAEIVKKRTDLARQPKGSLFEKRENRNRRNDQSTESDYAYHDKVSSIRMRQETENVSDSSSQVRRERIRKYQGSEWQQPTGENSHRYSSATTREKYREPSLCIVGDSMIRSINRKAMNQAIHSHDVHLKTFGGARIEDMRYHVEPALSSNPDTLILHCGTNNLRNDNAENLANKIIALAVEVKKRVANVAVSGIIFRADLEIEHKRKRVNYLVEVGLKDYGIDFISQDNIKAAHLDKWGLHLNFYGTNVLSGNFANFVSSA